MPRLSAVGIPGIHAWEDVNHAHWDHPQPIWTMDGDTFDNLTLTPSVDTSKFGHWHGFVVGGAIA